MKLRHMSRQELTHIHTANECALHAVHLLRLAGATKAANAIARSRKSIGGAIRHAERCIAHTPQPQAPAAMVPADLAAKLTRMTLARTKREYDRARK